MSEQLFWVPPGERRRAKPVGLAIAGGAALAVVLAAGLGYLGLPRGTDPDSGTFLGVYAARVALEALVGVAAIWVGLYYARLRGEGRGPALRALAILGVAWLLAGFAPALLVWNGRQEAAATFGAIDDNYAIALNRDKAEVVRQYNALGLRYVLWPASLAADKDLSHARATLAQARQLTADYRVRWLKSQTDERAEVAGASPASLPALDRRAAAYRTELAADVNLEDQLYAEFDAAIDFLGKTRGGWTADAHKVVFRRPGDLPMMLAHLTRLNDLAAQIDRLERPQFGDPFAPAPSILMETSG